MAAHHFPQSTEGVDSDLRSNSVESREQRREQEAFILDTTKPAGTTSRDSRDSLSHVELVTIEGAKHDLTASHSTEIVDLLATFFARGSAD